MLLTKATYSMINGAPVNAADFGTNGSYAQNIVTIQTAINSLGSAGGAYSTTNRNAIAVTADDIGISVFDTTLGKPVWLKNNSPKTWVDGAGTTV